jgi:hypothetical protein
MWHHGFANIINDNLFNFWVHICIFEFTLKHLKELKIPFIFVTNNDSIFNDDDVACHVSTRCYN